ncbi:hypothetical protein DRJ25_06380 [Candidatus Woesearchaeota archaeon]|nr:MAG: hypothetical protein DRJ25_06380 [Candidatus Woesearchaeota archaeon]
MRKIRETPLSEITLRKYEKPFKLSGRELVRKLCLSLGLLQPGDERDIIVDILFAIIRSEQPLDRKEIEERVLWLRQENSKESKGASSTNIARQLRRLRNLMIIEKRGKQYQLCEGNTLQEIFDEKIKKFYIEPISERVREYCMFIDQIRGENGSQKS